MTRIDSIRRSQFWSTLLCIICLTMTVWMGFPQTAEAFALKPASSQVTVTLQSQYGLCLNQEGKIDLNNANIIAFQDCPGFYPSLASMIVQNSPYQTLDDLLSIEGLTDTQAQALKMNFEHFKLSEPITDLSMRMPPRPALRSNP